MTSRNHYYVHGLRMPGLSSGEVAPTWQQQGYAQGQLLSGSLGTRMQRHGARFLDLQLGRFTGVDALAENYQSFTPYHYAVNDPVNWSDPSGLAPYCELWGHFQSYSDGSVVLEYTYYVCREIGLSANEQQASLSDDSGGSDSMEGDPPNKITNPELYTDECEGLGRLYQLGGFKQNGAVETAAYWTSSGFLILPNSVAGRTDLSNTSISARTSAPEYFLNIEGSIGSAGPFIGGAFIYYGIHTHPGDLISLNKYGTSGKDYNVATTLGIDIFAVGEGKISWVNKHGQGSTTGNANPAYRHINVENFKGCNLKTGKRNK